MISDLRKIYSKRKKREEKTSCIRFSNLKLEFMTLKFKIDNCNAILYDSDIKCYYETIMTFKDLKCF